MFLWPAGDAGLSVISFGGIGMENEKNKKIHFRSYIQWPIWLGLIWIPVIIVLSFLDKSSMMFAIVAFILFEVAAWVLYYRYKKKIAKELVEFAADYSQMQRSMLDGMEIPYAVCDEKGNVFWSNDIFKTSLGEKNKSRLNLKSVFPDVEGLMPSGEKDSIVHHVLLEKKSYRLSIRRITWEKGNGAENGVIPDETVLYAVYMYDETEILYLKKEWTNNQLVAGLIYMDNYEEALEGLEDVRKSLLIALVDRKITHYFSKYHCILRKLEKDKYLFVVAWKYLEDMREKKFTLLEDTKSVNIGNDMAITISMGIGVHGDSFEQSYEYAKVAIDLALGRGGDQVVLKDRNDVEYFGGKSHSLEKSTRVKARVKAHALQELIESADKVFCMGHHLSDIDSIGAAIGVCRAAADSGKKGYIVLDTVIGSIKPLLEKMKQSGEYNDLFISREKALEMVEDNSICCVVDVNRPNITECPELLKKAKRIVVIDHHRQTNERIDGAVLSYIEPYASSACEMVAEILQYYNDGVKLKNIEADAIYAGIVVDTDHFNSKTGIRTFEAAAFLRKSGADAVRVRKMFREDIEDYRVSADSIAGAEVFMDHFAISECTGKTNESLNVVAAQTANSLLNINGIKASFVMAEMENKIYISARSIDEINVQIIMEKLGGGGHMNIAGAQVEGYSSAQVRQMIKNTIQAMKEKGEI
jgi:c-di-AMP phosphodiesterase-like protein